MKKQAYKTQTEEDASQVQIARLNRNRIDELLQLTPINKHKSSHERRQFENSIYI